MVASSHGSSLMRPYLAASAARSRWPIDGATTSRPRSRSAASAPSRPAKRGQVREGQVDLRGHARLTQVARLPAQVRARASPGRAGAAASARGSAPLTTMSASSSVPSASATPVTRPSRSRMAITSALVRSSAPAARAAAARAAASAPGAAARVDRLARRATVVARGIRQQHLRGAGRARAPATSSACPRSASIARSASCSRRSSRKSATGLRQHLEQGAGMRLRQTAQVQPQAHARRPGRPAPATRDRAASGRRGATAPRPAPGSPRRTRSSARRPVPTPRRRPLGGPAHVAPQRDGRGRPARSDVTRAAGWTSRRPWRARPSSRAIEPRRRPTVCASSGTRAPGASSAVATAPPTASRRSRMSVRRPARAR